MTASSGRAEEGFALDMDEYYLSLGRFVDRFSDAEDRIFIAVSVLSRMTFETCQALLSGMRMKQGVSNIRRVHEARGKPTPPRLDEVLAHATAITTFRDHLLHSGARNYGFAIESSNRLRAHTNRSLKEVPVSPELLDRITADLDTIVAALDIFTLQQSFPDVDFAKESANQNHAVYLASLAPWRCKPGELDPKAQSSHPTTRPQKRPRQASPK
ncbi:hypothetical protein LZ009_03540 [Ramlibacter sp. XY19]|uniref:hypothetical protein n=1 Tax=Ramlibacter paludis TaxID=2908000 RepID=UPI0023DAF283|nr:hypothetical protein [Ramlibacter paludis]MCG2591844.1 hypothetical protein [Ramlibacter paludis]